MDLRQILLAGSYKKASDNIVEWILKDPGLLDTLFELYLDDHMRLCQRASNALTNIAEKYPELLNRFVPQIYDHIQKAPHDAALRNGLRFIRFLDVPEDYEGPIYDFCYQLIGDLKCPIGIRGYASVILVNIAQKYPELKAELQLYFDEYKNTGSEAFKRSMKKLINKLK